ncbi:hypothetical protein, partial [Pseudomonas sp. FW306-2-11AD]|uniref:hypothetical protein n=1 Tax=Pseudomonas sp. FW306-2-11AD TaxID=2070665 RepID=UPI001C47237C
VVGATAVDLIRAEPIFLETANTIHCANASPGATRPDMGERHRHALCAVRGKRRVKGIRFRRMRDAPASQRLSARERPD